MKNGFDALVIFICISVFVIFLIVASIGSKSSNYSTDTYTSTSTSKNKSTSSSAKSNDWKKGDGYEYNDDGYLVYTLPDGTVEISDGFGNYAQDTDGDGELDKFVVQ